MPTQTDLVVTLTPPSKTVAFSGSSVISVRETVDILLYGFGSASAASLIVGVIRNGVTCGLISGLTDYGTYYGGVLNLNTTEMVTAMEGTTGRQTRPFLFFVWDSTNNDLLGNGAINIQANPYSSSMVSPSPIASVGEVFTAVEKARLASMEDDADATYYATHAVDTALAVQAQSHQVIMANTAAGNVNLTLPSATGFIGSILIIKTSGNYTLTITPSGGESINGSAGAKTITTAYGSYRLYPLSGAWICPISANP